jgi:hypothetical protein
MLTLVEVRQEIAEALAKAGVGQAPKAELVPLFLEAGNGRLIRTMVPKSELERDVLSTPDFRQDRAA